MGSCVAWWGLPSMARHRSTPAPCTPSPCTPSPCSPESASSRCHSRASQYPPSTDRGGGARPPSHMRDTSDTSCNAASPVRTPLAVAPGSAEPDATEPMCFADTCFADTCFADTCFADTCFADMCFADMCFADMCFAYPGSHLLKCAQARACSTTPGPTLRTKPTGYNPPASSSAGCQL